MFPSSPAAVLHGNHPPGPGHRPPQTPGRWGANPPPPPPSHTAYTCEKPGHSCMRNIMSFKQMPGRACFKRIGRAFMAALTAVAPGYGIRNLSKGKDTITKALGQQSFRHSNNFCCIKCGFRMSSPTFYTADAGQSYEMTPPKGLPDFV